MKVWHILAALLAICAAAYLPGQMPAPISGTTGLVTLGLKNNPRYVQLGVFALFLAGAFLYYDKFNKK